MAGEDSKSNQDDAAPVSAKPGHNFKLNKKLAVVCLAVLGIVGTCAWAALGGRVPGTDPGVANQSGWAHIQMEKEMHEKPNRKENAVYALKDIAAGQTITDGEMEEKMVLATEIPQDALFASALCVGRATTHSIKAGSIIRDSDLAPLQIIIRQHK